MTEIALSDEQTTNAISRCFGQIHQALAEINDLVVLLDDPGARELAAKMGLSVLAPMRKLRLHLGIPYVPEED